MLGTEVLLSISLWIKIEEKKTYKSLEYLNGEGIFGDCINTNHIVSLKHYDLALLIKGYNQSKRFSTFQEKKLIPWQCINSKNILKGRSK